MKQNLIEKPAFQIVALIVIGLFIVQVWFGETHPERLAIYQLFKEYGIDGEFWSKVGITVPMVGFAAVIFTNLFGKKGVKS